MNILPLLMLHPHLLMWCSRLMVGCKPMMVGCKLRMLGCRLRLLECRLTFQRGLWTFGLHLTTTRAITATSSMSRSHMKIMLCVARLIIICCCEILCRSISSFSFSFYSFLVQCSLPDLNLVLFYCDHLNPKASQPRRPKICQIECQKEWHNFKPLFIQLVSKIQE